MDADLTRETFSCPTGAETQLGDIISARMFEYKVSYLRMPLVIGFVHCACRSYHYLGPDQLVNELEALGYRRLPGGDCPPREWMVEYAHLLDDPEAALALLLSADDLALEATLTAAVDAQHAEMQRQGQAALVDEAVLSFAAQLGTVESAADPRVLSELFQVGGMPVDIVDR